jgi:hypothetical protein
MRQSEGAGTALTRFGAPDDEDEAPTGANWTAAARVHKWYLDTMTVRGVTLAI